MGTLFIVPCDDNRVYNNTCYKFCTGDNFYYKRNMFSFV